MTYKHLKRCSISLVVREMEIKTIMIYHFISTRMATVKKTMCWWRCEKIGILIHAGWNVKWWNCFEKVWQFLKKINIELPYDPTEMKYTPKRSESMYSYKTHKYFTALLMKAEMRKHPIFSSTDKCINKM